MEGRRRLVGVLLPPEGGGSDRRSSQGGKIGGERVCVNTFAIVFDFRRGIVVIRFSPLGDGGGPRGPC